MQMSKLSLTMIEDKNETSTRLTAFVIMTLISILLIYLVRKAYRPRKI